MGSPEPLQPSGKQTNISPIKVHLPGGGLGWAHVRVPTVFAPIFCHTIKCLNEGDDCPRGEFRQVLLGK